MFKHLGRAIVSLVIAALVSRSTFAQDELAIHHINVQQGDCTLIIGPDGTTFLIDAGNTGKGTAEVVPYLQSIGIPPAAGLDFMLATHRDSDHIGGLDEVIAAGYNVRHRVWDNGSEKSDDAGEPISQFLAAAAITQAGPVQAMPLGHTVDLGGGASATCVAVGGTVLGHGAVTGATSENDLSVAILVRFGNFEYLTGGDLGGGDDDRSCTGRVTTQANVETPLAISLMPGGGANLLPAHGIEVLDVNHHGSESSTNRDCMNLLSPTLAVINTGSGQGSNYRHPREDVVENVLLAGAQCITAAPALVLQTEEGSPSGTDTSSAGFCVGDVVIRTTGAGTFVVSATGQVSQGPDERVAAGMTSARAFPLDGAAPHAATGVIITEIMRDPAAVDDNSGEWFEVFNPTSIPIDMNGWTIRDDDSDSHVITSGAPVLVPPQGRIVLGRNGDPAQNGGYQPAYVYSGVNLANSTDELVIMNGATEVDRVAFTGGAPWPHPVGASMVLLNSSANNNDGSNWAAATSRGGSFTNAGADLGTPGVP